MTVCEQSLSVGALLRAGISISPQEAVAIVEQLRHADQFDAQPGGARLDAINLHATGRVTRPCIPDGAGDTRLTEGALVIRAALPDPGAPDDSPHAAILRQLAHVVLVPEEPRVFTSLDHFCDALRPFGTADPEQTVRSLVARAGSDTRRELAEERLDDGIAAEAAAATPDDGAAANERRRAGAVDGRERLQREEDRFVPGIQIIDLPADASPWEAEGSDEQSP